MSKDKYPRIFPRQMLAILFVILQRFFATRAILKIGNFTSARSARIAIIILRANLNKMKIKTFSTWLCAEYKPFKVKKTVDPFCFTVASVDDYLRELFSKRVEVTIL